MERDARPRIRWRLTGGGSVEERNLEKGTEEERVTETEGWRERDLRKQREERVTETEGASSKAGN